MTPVEQILTLLQQCNEEERRALLTQLRDTLPPHPFEVSVNARVEVILEALHRAPELSLRGVRGLIGEATFAVSVAPTFTGWVDVTPPGNHAYDLALQDSVGRIDVQVKMQRKQAGVPLIRRGEAVVEVQRTRNGTAAGEATRPYRYGTFHVLAVCMEPSNRRWNSFLYIPERWLLPRPENPALIGILQPVALEPNQIWTDDFDEVARRYRNGLPRPQ